MRKKLVIFDVDGTIISKDHIVPESASDAIRRVRESGNYAVYYTGRPYTHVERSVSSIGFDACICTMGAYIKIGDEVLQDVKPEPENAQEVVRLVREYRLDAAFESCKGIQFDKARPLPQFLQGLKKHFSDRGFVTDEDIDREGFTFEKVCVWTNEDSDLDGFEREVGKYLSLAGKKQNMAEFIAKGVSIPESLKRVQRYFGVGYDDSYAIGDSINDIPMLMCAAHSMAMGQAADELKEKVEFVTKDICEDGLAFAMKHYGLISTQ